MKNILLSVLLLVFSSVTFADLKQNENNKIPNAVNLFKDLKTSTKNNQTIVIFFHSQDCLYCQILKTEVLQPMQIVQKNSNYLILTVEVDKNIDMINFKNQKTTMQDFTEKFNIGVTPTLLFFDNKGVERAKRIIGLLNVNLIGYYIDKNINIVSEKIKNND